MQVNNAISDAFIGAPIIWNDGYTGQGMRVAIIDSGIDYRHAMFGDPTTGNAYTTFPNAKVVGGYDFVGDAWDPLDPAHSALSPDSDPMDCDLNGHGSHVAGTVAGFGITKAGQTYPAGPITAATWSSTTNLLNLRVGPGVAPQAVIYSYKIGACDTWVSPLGGIMAMDAAADPNGDGNPADHVDVINMSWGGGFGSGNDPSAIAADNAALVGISVVISAGNAYDTTYVLGDPGGSSRAITVASAHYNGAAGQTVNINSSPTLAAGTVYVGGSGGGDLTSVLLDGTLTITGPVVMATPANGCGAISTNVAGSILLINRGTCTFATKAHNGESAVGGPPLAVIIANMATSGSPNDAPNMAGDGAPVSFPVVSLNYSDGQALRNSVAAGATNISLSFGFATNATTADVLSSFSSRGPRRAVPGVGIALKPDVTAPGHSVDSTAVGTGSGGVSFGGTSMASPHVAGLATILREAHPTWTPEQIKALIMNTAVHDLFLATNSTPPTFGPARVGAGRVDGANAIADNVIAYWSDHPELVSVTFGLDEVTAAGSMTRTITVQNLGSSSATYNVGLSSDDPATTPLASFSVSPSQVTIAGGGTATITLTMNLAAPTTAYPFTLEPTMDYYTIVDIGSLYYLNRSWLPLAAGYVTLTGSGLSSLRVPYLAVPRPASVMTQPTSLSLTGTTGSVSLPLTGQGVDTEGGASLPGDLTSVTSIASIFDLVYSGTDGPDVFGPMERSARIRYVGVTSDYAIQLEAAGGDAATALANTTVFFAIATFGEWSTHNENQFSVYIGQNGAESYQLFTIGADDYLTGQTSDVFVAALAELPGTSGPITDFLNPIYTGGGDLANTYQLNNNVVIVPVRAQGSPDDGIPGIGLTTTNSRFNFRVEGFNIPDYEAVIDTTSVLYYDPINAIFNYVGADTTGYTPYQIDLPGNTFQVNYNLGNYTSGPLNLLVLHHHNADPTTRPQVVSIAAPGIPTGLPGSGGSSSASGGGTPGRLPSTGYPPAGGNQLPSLILASLVVLFLVGGGLVLRLHRR
jgi:subtilisin family serine protease